MIEVRWDQPAIALAYLARYAFDTSLAFYAVLAIAAAEQRKETILATLAQGPGPVAA